MNSDLSTIIQRNHPRLKHAFSYIESLLYNNYYKDILDNKKVSKENFNVTLDYFISLEEYEKCAKMMKYAKR